jgi:hypothetical protein
LIGDIENELEQLAMDARCALERVLSTDATNKASDIGRQGRAARPPPRLPAPERAKASSVPAEQGLWLEGDRGVEQRREQAVEADKDQTVCRLQSGSGERRRFQDDELLIDDLGFTLCR